MLGLKADVEVLSELVKMKSPAVGQLMAQYPGIWMLVVSRWFICLYVDVLPIEVRENWSVLAWILSKLPVVPFPCRRSCGSGTVSSTKAPRFSSALPWRSSCTTSQRSCEPALCLTCVSASDRSPVEPFLWNVTPSCRWGPFLNPSGTCLSKCSPENIFDFLLCLKSVKVWSVIQCYSSAPYCSYLVDYLKAILLSISITSWTVAFQHKRLQL